MANEQGTAHLSNLKSINNHWGSNLGGEIKMTFELWSWKISSIHCMCHFESKSFGNRHHWGWQSRWRFKLICDTLFICDWEILCESGCLRMQPKVWGGKIHLKLNIGERPIAHKYREGKMQSTLKREWKGLELVMREAFEAPIRSFLCQSKNETHFWENSVLFFLFGLVGDWFVDKNEMTRETLFFVLSWWSQSIKKTLNEKRMHFFINKWASISFYQDNEKLKGQFKK